MASNTTRVDTESAGEGVTPNGSGHNNQIEKGTQAEDRIDTNPKGEGVTPNGSGHNNQIEKGTQAEDRIDTNPKVNETKKDGSPKSNKKTGGNKKKKRPKNKNVIRPNPNETVPIDKGSTESAIQMASFEPSSENQGSNASTSNTTPTINPPIDQKTCAYTCGHVTSIVGIGGGFVLAASKIVLMVVVGWLISTSMDISKVKSCELENALNSLNLEYSPYPCKYKAITEESRDLKTLGIGALSSNFVLLILILCKMFCAYIHRKNNKCISRFFFVTWILVFINGIFVSYFSYCNHSTIAEVTKEQPNVDYAKLQSKMVTMLEQQYLSDNISASDSNSRNWNNFFIQFDCCAVREVQGTTNDFDNTPWCTTSGSCQATASQIPKTCCKDVTQDDYQNAPSLCHASVNPGTYKPSCISRIRGMSTENINEFQLTAVISSLFVLFVFQAFESAFVFVGILVTCVVICCNMPCKKEAVNPTTDTQSDQHLCNS